MSIILVTGGTGTLGRGVVSRLRESGEEVRILSRRPQAGTHVGDLATGEGVAAATAGAEVVVHAASDTRRFGRADLAQTRHLLAAVGGIRHLVYVSIVGIDEIPFAYYRRKLSCEREIAGSGVPHTIVRATQFHELLAMVLGAAERLPAVPLPLDFRFQSIAASEAAAGVVEVLGEEPGGRTRNIGGPDVLTLGQMAEAWRARRGRPGRLWSLPVPGRVAAGFRQGLNTTPANRFGRQSWSDFVAGQPAN